MFRSILSLIIIVAVVKLARTVQVYEDNDDDQEPVDITGNANSTGPVVYPNLNNTDDSMEVYNETDENEKQSETPQTLKIISLSNHTTIRPPIVGTNNASSMISLRSNVNNISLNNTSVKVKENSSLNQRPTYKVNAKPFVSSPIDIVARKVEQEKALDTDSFQPMIERPFIPSPPFQRPINRPSLQPYYYTTPKSQIEEPVHSNSHHTSSGSQVQENSHIHIHYHTPRPQHHEEGTRDSGLGLTFNEPRSKHHHYPEEYNQVASLSDKRPDSNVPPVLDYDPFKKEFYPPEMNLNEEQPRYNSLQDYSQKSPQGGGVIAWPEGDDNDKYKASTTWTTEQPEFQTNPYKYLPTPTVYEPPKGFFSNALSFLSQSFKPSAPPRPYPFEVGTEYPKSFPSSNSEYSFPTSSSSDQNDGKSGHKTYEKYEIITTSQPEYTILSKPPEAFGGYHNSEIIKPHRHNLPWHKILKVLTAIIPLGLLVSALTPNVVLINPNATNPNNRHPFGNIYSYATRQRSVEPEDGAFNEQMVKILDGLLLNNQDPGSTCFRQAVCHALVTNKTESLLTREENMDFQNKICKNVEKVSEKCNSYVQ